MNKKEGINAVSMPAVSSDTDLVPSNPKVIAAAKKLRWRPERAIQRIKSALPAVFEQQLYLNVGATFGLLPESMAKLLRIFIQYRSLDEDDLKFKEIGKNVVSSVFSDFAEFIRECLNLLKIISAEETEARLTIENAAWIVANYGTEDPERLIEMVDCQLEDFCEFLGISNRRPYAERLRICIWTMVTQVIPMNQEGGVTDLFDLTDFLGLGSARREAICRLIGQNIPDFLSFDHFELKNWARILKDLGVIE